MTRRELVMGMSRTGLLATASAFVRPSASGLLLSPDIGLGGTSFPDPLIFDNGKPVNTAADWHLRRTEILAKAATQMYGVAPSRSPKQRFEVIEKDGSYFSGLARRRQVRIFFEGDSHSRFMDLLIYLPRHNKPIPVILGINFWGNHTLSPDPDVILSSSYIEDGKNIFMDLSYVHQHRATQACRGIDARRWPAETILKRGYGLATLYRGDIDPDDPDRFEESVRAAYPTLRSRRDNFSAIGAWAWALQRALDCLVTDPDVDAKRIIAYGWSRLGKAALWAAALPSSSH
jgi:hypothetical protein